MTTTGGAEALLAGHVGEALALCEAHLATAVAAGLPPVVVPAADTLAAGGKRLRPLLVFCCAPRALHGDTDLIRAAAAVEMVHMATLVHDDLLDGATLRRGRVTVAHGHGPAQAVRVGDFLFARAFAELAATGSPDAVRLLAATAVDLSLGELAQQRAAHRLDLAEEDYLDRCHRKTASLFATACRLGALLGGADAETIDRLGAFGAAVGMAFQIFDDILDVAGSDARTGKRRGADLRDGTVTLPVILAVRHDPGLARDIAAAEGDRDVEELCERLAVHPGTAEARARALRYVSQARAALDGPLDGADRTALVAIADGVVDRYS